MSKSLERLDERQNNYVNLLNKMYGRTNMNKASN